MSEEKGKENNEIKNAQPPKQKPLFTQEQIAEQVRNFIYAYQRGRIRLTEIKQPSHEHPVLDLIYKSSIDPERLSKGQSRESEIKKIILDLISVCVGTKKATDEERYQKMLDLFDTIRFCYLCGTQKKCYPSGHEVDMKKMLTESLVCGGYDDPRSYG